MGGSGGPSKAGMGTIVQPLNDTAQQDAISICNAAIDHNSERMLTESIRNQYFSGLLTADGAMRGTITLSTITMVTIQTGDLSNKGFFKGDWIAQIENIRYQGQWHGTVNYDNNSKTYNLHGTVDGLLDGKIEASLSEGTSGSNVYDMLAATWSFRLNNGIEATSSGIMYLHGALSYKPQQEYPGTQLRYRQSSAKGTLTGDYTGNINLVLTGITVDDASHPDNGNGFGFINYRWEEFTGSGNCFVETLPLNYRYYRASFDDPLASTALFWETGDGALNTNLLITIKKLVIGQAPQPKLDVRISGPDNATPGDLVAYRIRLKNEGQSAAYRVMIRVFLAPEMRFITAQEGWNYFKLGESDWVNYPDRSVAPEIISWALPEVPNMSVQEFSIMTRMLWGIQEGKILDANVELYEY